MESKARKDGQGVARRAACRRPDSGLTGHGRKALFDRPLVLQRRRRQDAM
jgi:hypothetical protein